MNNKTISSSTNEILYLHLSVNICRDKIKFPYFFPLMHIFQKQLFCLLILQFQTSKEENVICIIAVNEWPYIFQLPISSSYFLVVYNMLHLFLRKTDYVVVVSWPTPMYIWFFPPDNMDITWFEGITDLGSHLFFKNSGSDHGF